MGDHVCRLGRALDLYNAHCLSNLQLRPDAGGAGGRTCAPGTVCANLDTRLSRVTRRGRPSTRSVCAGKPPSVELLAANIDANIHTLPEQAAAAAIRRRGRRAHLRMGDRVRKLRRALYKEGPPEDALRV